MTEHQELISLALQGDQDAYSKLFKVLLPIAKKTAYRYLQPQDREDFEADFTSKVLLILHKFEGKSQFTTWATRIAFNEAFMILRKRKYQHISIDQPVGDGLNLHNVLSYNTRPSLALEVEELLGPLPEHKRKLLVQFHLEGYRLTELTEMYKTTEGNMKSRLKRARR